MYCCLRGNHFEFVMSGLLYEVRDREIFGKRPQELTNAFRRFLGSRPRTADRLLKIQNGRHTNNKIFVAEYNKCPEQRLYHIFHIFPRPIRTILFELNLDIFCL